MPKAFAECPDLDLTPLRQLKTWQHDSYCWQLLVWLRHEQNNSAHLLLLSFLIFWLIAYFDHFKYQSFLTRLLSNKKKRKKTCFLIILFRLKTIVLAFGEDICKCAIRDISIWNNKRFKGPCCTAHNKYGREQRNSCQHWRNHGKVTLQSFPPQVTLSSSMT